MARLRVIAAGFSYAAHLLTSYAKGEAHILATLSAAVDEPLRSRWGFALITPC